MAARRGAKRTGSLTGIDAEMDAALDLEALDFEALVAGAPVPLVVVTRHGLMIRFANRAAAGLLGLKPKHVVGRPLTEFRERRGAGQETGRAGGDLPDPLPGGDDPVGPYSCRRTDGRTVLLEVHTSPFHADSSGAELCLLHLVDVTRRRNKDAARQRREALSAAVSEVRLEVMRGAGIDDALALICRRARELMQAEDAVVLVPDDAQISAEVRAGSGPSAAPLVGSRVDLDGSVAGRVLDRGLPARTCGSGPGVVVIDGLLPANASGAVIALPVRTPEVAMGALCLLRSSEEPFTSGDLKIVLAFADQAAAALHIGDLREARERLRVLEDRERIARDLHDSVIQDLFAAGMALDSVRPHVATPEARERLAATIEELDGTIKAIRATIFALAPDGDVPRSLPVQLRQLLLNRELPLQHLPVLELDGDLESLPGAVTDHVTAIVGEALSNIARHAGATSSAVTVGRDVSGTLLVQVRDDGRGFHPDTPRGDGLHNMRRRAELLGGRFAVVTAPGEGTTVTITATT